MQNHGWVCGRSQSKLHVGGINLNKRSKPIGDPSLDHTL